MDRVRRGPSRSEGTGHLTFCRNTTSSYRRATEGTAEPERERGFRLGPSPPSPSASRSGTLTGRQLRRYPDAARYHGRGRRAVVAGIPGQPAPARSRDPPAVEIGGSPHHPAHASPFSLFLGTAPADKKEYLISMMRQIHHVPPHRKRRPQGPGGQDDLMMIDNRDDIPLRQVFSTVLISEVAVLLAVVVMALAFRP